MFQPGLGGTSPVTSKFPLESIFVGPEKLKLCGNRQLIGGNEPSRLRVARSEPDQYPTGTSKSEYSLLKPVLLLYLGQPAYAWLLRSRVALSFFGVFLVSVNLLGCAGWRFAETRVLGENDQYAVVIAGNRETYASLARRYLGDASLAWRIEDANENLPLEPGMKVLIRKTDPNRIGVFPDGYQLVPILSYHQFGENRGRISVTREQFTQQLELLRNEGYRPVHLRDVASFLRGEKALPNKAIVLTIDDGYQSAYEIAFPELKRFGFPATVFIYSDYINNGGLTWSQMKEMEASGLISFQAHSKTHDDLTVRSSQESFHDYMARLGSEVAEPHRKLEKRMSGKVIGFAYPFGAANRPVVDEIRQNGYEIGLTVRRGSNPFFVFPYGLRRTMVYQKDGIDEFRQALKTFETQILQ